MQTTLKLGVEGKVEGEGMQEDQRMLLNTKEIVYHDGQITICGVSLNILTILEQRTQIFKQSVIKKKIK